TIHSAARSLMEPVGLRSSSYAHSRTGGAPSGTSGARRGSPTRGMSPQASSSDSYRMPGSSSAALTSQRAGATGHRRQNGHGVTVGQLGVHRPDEPDVLVVDVDVHESVQRSILGDQPRPQARVARVEVGEQR